MVDEFQDTNPLQKPAARPDRRGQTYSRSATSAQSIYGFRNADVARVPAGRRAAMAEAGPRREACATKLPPPAAPVLEKIDAAAFESVWPDGFEALSAGSDSRNRACGRASSC